MGKTVIMSIVRTTAYYITDASVKLTKAKVSKEFATCIQGFQD